MSAETDVRALLAGYAPLTALVSTRISQDVADEGAAYPLVVFTVRHAPIQAVDGTTVADQCTVSVESWAATASGAAAVADQVAAAFATAPAARAVRVLDRGTGHDAETGYDSDAITVEWWA